MSTTPDLGGKITFLRPQSIADGVYEEIYQRLMSLDIPPGSRMLIDGLARDMDVSQTPVREALARLEREGLVRKAHQKGYSAAPQLSRKQFDDLYRFRLMVEPESARQACANMTSEALERLESAAADMEVSEQPLDRNSRYSRFARADSHFHEEILRVADNDIARQAVTDQHVHLHIFRLMFHSRVTQEALEEHRVLLSAFRAEDGDAAHAAMTEHIRRSHDRLVAAFS